MFQISKHDTKHNVNPSIDKKLSQLQAWATIGSRQQLIIGTEAEELLEARPSNLLFGASPGASFAEPLKSKQTKSAPAASGNVPLRAEQLESLMTQRANYNLDELNSHPPTRPNTESLASPHNSEVEHKAGREDRSLINTFSPLPKNNVPAPAIGKKESRHLFSLTSFDEHENRKKMLVEIEHQKIRKN